MTLPDSEVVARVGDRLEFLDGDSHHDLCPQHPWNNVIDDQDPCECEQLALDEAEAASDMAADARSEGALACDVGGEA